MTTPTTWLNKLNRPQINPCQPPMNWDELEGGGRERGGVITNFWSIVLDDHWSKKIYRPKMIVDVRWSCFLFLSRSFYTMSRFVLPTQYVLTFFCFCSFSGQCWPVAVVCVPPQERRLRPFKALWHRHLPAKQMYSSSWSSSSSPSSSSPSSKQEYSSRGHRPGASISSLYTDLSIRTHSSLVPWSLRNWNGFPKS